jgi:dienelactone hydrolase
MHRSVLLLGAIALFVVVGTRSVRAQEEAVPLDKIPKAVMEALLSKFPKAKIDTCTRAKELGAIVYDIEFLQQNGRKGEADIKENGTYINYEKQIDAKALPKAVRDAIEKRYPKSTLKEIMEETEVTLKNERLSAFEVILATADRKEVEVRVSPDGKILEDTGAEKPKAKSHILPFLLVALAAAGVTLPPARAEAQAGRATGREMDIATSGGVVLKATYHAADSRGPALLLIHQCSTDRHSWDGLVKDLVGSGIHVLTFDQRGWGRSGGSKMDAFNNPRIGVADAEAAFKVLASQPGVDALRMGVGGSSCGATYAADLAAAHREVKAVVLLSGNVSRVAMASLAATPSLAVYGAYSERDPEGAGVRDAVQQSRHPRSTLKTFRGAAHGIEMFARNRDLQPDIVRWLQVELLAKPR